jgi:hypothetical protein
MNRREFLFHTGVGSIGMTMLSPWRIILPSFAPTGSSSDLLAARTPSWLRRFDGAYTSSLLNRRRFRLLMNGVFNGMSAPFWFNLSIHTTARAYMRKPHYVTLQRRRYLVATGSMMHCAASRAMLWIDTRFDPAISAVPRAALTVIDVGTSGRHLWMIDNNPAGTGPLADIPHNLKHNIRQWLLSHPFVNTLAAEPLQRPTNLNKRVMKPRALFRRLEGGMLQSVDSIDHRQQTATVRPLKKYGVAHARCERSVPR